MNRRYLAAGRGFVLLLALAGFVLFPAPAAAQDEGPQVDVIATGLNNPRGMAFGPGGALYVAEAGMGGTVCVAVDVAQGPGQACFGQTGAVARIQRGRVERVFTDLPSLADSPQGLAATGVHDVAFTDKGLRVVIGLGGNPEEVRPLIPDKFEFFGALGRPVREQETMTGVVDLAGYEVTNNPDPAAVDSNPYAVLHDGGQLIVVDAGGNSLLSVDPDGAIETLAIFPSKVVDTPPGLDPSLPAQIPMEAVPNSLVKGPDDAYYVGQLNGFPFLAGEANVYRVVPGQEPEIYASGFTATIDIAFDKEGNLYVLEIAANGLLAAEMEGDFSGVLLRVNSDGSREVVMQEGLWAPTGMAIAPNGDIYVANYGIFPGEGEILRIRP